MIAICSFCPYISFSYLIFCCNCSVGSFQWKRGTAWHSVSGFSMHHIITSYDIVWHRMTSYHPYLHLEDLYGVWSLSICFSGIHHHTTAVQNAVRAVQPQLRGWSPALQGKNGKIWKGSIIIYHDIHYISFLHHVCIMPSSSASKWTWRCHVHPQGSRGQLYIWVADFKSPLEPSKVGPVGMQNPLFLFLVQTRHSCGPRRKLAWSHFEKTGAFKFQ